MPPRLLELGVWASQMWGGLDPEKLKETFLTRCDLIYYYYYFLMKKIEVFQVGVEVE